MKKIIIKLSVLLIFVFTFFGIELTFNQNEFVVSAYALEEEVYTDMGVCGTSANWYFYEDTGLLSITGSGAITESNWSSYRYKIRKIVVSEDIESFSKGIFYGCTNLQEISIPFVGESRDAIGPNATFGYIFDYTTTNAYSSGDSDYKYLFHGNNTTCIGRVRKTNYTGTTNFGIDYGYIPASNSNVTYLDLGWTSECGYYYNSSNIASTQFYDYKVGSEESSTFANQVAPHGNIHVMITNIIITVSHFNHITITFHQV